MREAAANATGLRLPRHIAFPSRDRRTLYSMEMERAMYVGRPLPMFAAPYRHVASPTRDSREHD